KLRAPDGTQIPLLTMLQTDTRDTPSAIQRIDRSTALRITANLASGKTMPEARKEIGAALGAVAFPPGYRWSFGQGFDREDQAGKQMLFNTLIALVLVYVVMCAMFESLIFPAAILLTFVFSIFGVYWLFWLTGTTFSIMAAIGILILMGVVVNNGIVMIVHINQLRHEGHLRREALVMGAKERLRPVLMTMATAILGMMPLAIGGAAAWSDGPPYAPMARAIAGGLAFSTVLTLLALPCIYSLLDDARLWSRRVIADARAGRIRRLRDAPPSAAGDDRLRISQQQAQQAREPLAVRRLEPTDRVDSRLREYRLHVREAAKAVLAMVGAHARRADAAERQGMLA